MKKLVLALVLSAGVVACTPAQQASLVADGHTAASSALTLLTVAKGEPALVEVVKASLLALVYKLDPKNAAMVAQALSYVDAGNLDVAIELLRPVAIDTATITSSSR